MTEQKPSNRKPSLLANLLISVLITALALWLADLAFRAYERNWLAPVLPDPQGSAPVNLGGLRYNEGWVARETSEGEFRILSHGDSFAYSVMEPPLSYAGVLERDLGSAGLERTPKVVNLGEPATGTRQYRLAYDYWSEVFEHQGVLFMIFIGNDLLDDAYLHAAIEWAPNEAVIRGGNPILDPGNPRIPHKFPLRMFDYAYAWLMTALTRSEEPLPEGYNWAGLTDFDRETFLGINARYMENFDPGRLHALLPGYEQVLLLLRRAAELQAQGVHVAVAIGPSEAQVDDRLRAEVLAFQGREASEFDLHLPSRIIQRLRETHAPGVPLFDLTAAFRAEAQRTGESLYFRRNTHWNEAGNRVAGESLAASLLHAWFGQPRADEPMPESLLPSNVLLDEAGIDEYLRPLQHLTGAGEIRISGAVRAIHMLDGIVDQNDNWAVAPLNQPVLVDFAAPVMVDAIRLHLFGADGRRYRYRLEIRTDDDWVVIEDGEQLSASGIQELAWHGSAIDGLRLTGLENSKPGPGQGDAFLHIQELELIRRDSE
ncbi:MAG: hypothetical protein HKN58_10020 [Xanthomonadales bacterium]|nr:hypothetical protein [Xanthomonadales bacterium]